MTSDPPGVTSRPSAGVSASPRSSSSSTVRVAPVTATVIESAVARPFDAIPDTVTCLSGASTSLSLAVTVTKPALAVAPAAMVRVAAVLKVKSPAAAGATGEAATVTVVGADDGRVSTAVTVETPPASEIDDGFSTRVTPGASSSSVVLTSTSTSVRPL